MNYPEKMVQRNPLTVDECEKKWDALLDGLTEPRERRLTAWVMECEVKFLLAEPEMRPTWLKFVMPILRMAVSALAAAEHPTFEQTYEAVHYSATCAFSSEPHGCVSYDPPTAAELHAAIAPLAERTHDFIQKFPG